MNRDITNVPLCHSAAKSIQPIFFWTASFLKSEEQKQIQFLDLNFAKLRENPYYRDNENSQVIKVNKMN